MQDKNQSPFESYELFKQQFDQGLHQLLDQQQLSTFILVLANSTQHKALFDELQPKLREQFNYFVKKYSDLLEQGNQIDVVDEDFLVFLKMYMLGFESIKLTEHRNEAEWHCQFNHIRSFRPRRISSFHNDQEITAPYDKYTFNFNKPFMQKECFWAGELNNKKIDLFFNKYPFAEYHGLFVPEREACLPQFLDESMHQYMWQLMDLLGSTMPGVGFGYNSYGAYASVNHLHFQMFVEPDGFPVKSPEWKHNGGSYSYPLDIFKYDDLQSSWQKLHQLHKARQPYNVLYSSNEVFVIPRQVQGATKVPDWSSGFTWYELCGGMLMFNYKDYQQVKTLDIVNTLSSLNLS